MRIRIWAVSVLVFWAASPALAARFSGMAVFGDSLSDVGNVFTLTAITSPLTGVIYPNAPYYAGRFSNGPVWTDYLAAALGHPDATRPWMQGGTNYAVGGANTDARNTSVQAKLGPLASLGNFGVTTQVSSYVNSHPAARTDVLNVVWAGSNDFLDGGTDPFQSAMNTAIDILILHHYANGREFLVPNLPPLGLTPRYFQSNGPGGNQQMTLRAYEYNYYLGALLDILEQTYTDMNIYRVDIFGNFMNILQNPALFGFDNITQPAYNENTGAVVANPNRYLFWDDIHPTARGHELVAQLAWAALPADAMTFAVPEPATLGLLLVGLPLIAHPRRRVT